MATILIGADICPIEGNKPYFIQGDATALFNDLLPEINAADLVVANLECPFIEQSSPISKTGPTFGEPGECIHGLTSAGFDVLCLANNHIMDHGRSGLEHTISVCEQAGIDVVGAGENLEAARRILVKNVKGCRVGLLAMAEREFSIAGASSWGANPLDLIDFVRTVTKEWDCFDYLIVLLHGAAEFQALTPRIQKTCRFIIEMGAHAVIVQHPHVLGGYEEYLHGHIVYGQGALVMDEAVYRESKTFHEGFMVKLTVDENLCSTMELIPFVQSQPVPGARKMNETDGQELLHRLASRSRDLKHSDFVASEWQKYCEARRYSYISGLLGHGRILRRLNRLGFLGRWLYNRRILLGTKISYAVKRTERPWKPFLTRAPPRAEKVNHGTNA